ncbi:FAD-dependent oxidoreductase [Thalassotalea psychrophila]|uniref:FAD-dependent oxidoreductase n=1 Tax=Thalassotalea psychrophila TaxID=3065647 RepID=A0ABY9TWB0_9GAMM|nr:FAD-dependent oxidoreductase [Colwelliaceae bacterium SQ149]
MSKITRRNFINGSLVLAGSSLLPFGCSNDAIIDSAETANYPPALTGLRGSHKGSNTHAHAKAWQNKSDWGETNALQEEYDLVVVGGGISGLSAAYFYQQKHGVDKKILILENHDDFGGHARRNEHTVDGDTRLTFGGSQTIQNPESYSDVSIKLLDDLGIDLERFKSAYDFNFYKKHNLKALTYFNKKTFSEDKVVMHPYSNYPYFIEGIDLSELSVEEAAEQAPLSQKGKAQLLRILKGGLHAIDVPKNDLAEYIATHSYFDYLKNTLGVDDPAVLEMARNSCADNHGAGTDVLSIEEAMDSGVIGFSPSAMQDFMAADNLDADQEKHSNLYGEEQYIHHFPDGNSTIARMLVKKMIPKVGKGENAEEILLSKFNYEQLDKDSNIVRLRLNSTVINVEHDGDPLDSNSVSVSYINDDKAYRVKSKAVVMACYNMMIPHLVPDLPEEQAAAMKRLVKIPLMYTSVGLKNWKAIKDIGMGIAMCPGNMHQVVYMDFPVNMGGYQYTKSPEAPCVIQMVSCPFGGTVGDPPVEQFKQGRYKMLNLKFEDYEQEIREHLTGMLPTDSFDFDRDVESITVNRWAHGYAHGGVALFDPELSDLAIIGRKPFGRITIANIDSATSSYANIAIDQAWRAVNELK